MAGTITAFKFPKNKQIIITTKTHKIEKKNEQHNQEWSWEETSEVLEALDQLDKSTQVLNELKK